MLSFCVMLVELEGHEHSVLRILDLYEDWASLNELVKFVWIRVSDLAKANILQQIQRSRIILILSLSSLRW